MKKAIKSIGLMFATALVTASSLHVNADTTTYTLNSDFDLGLLSGVNHDAPNINQLQLNTTGTTFPFLWVSNAGEHTFSKIDTDGAGGNGCEVARYYTWFTATAPTNNEFAGAAPSRTAVNANGDVYVVNRHFDGRMPDIIKISVSGGVDRNGNGVIDTSIDTNGNCAIDPSEMMPIVDDGDGILNIQDFSDERVLWVRQYGTNSSLGRSVCLDTGGNVWAGTYSTRQYYKFDPNGNLLAGPISTGSTSNYGCAVDANGMLFGASLGSGVVEINTNTNTYLGTHFGSSNYGIALGNGKVYLGSTLRSHDPVTHTFGPVIASSATGVAVDGDGAVWFGTPTLRKFVLRTDGSGFLNPTPVCSTGSLGGRGPIVDKNGHAWTINLSNNSVSQYDTNCNFISTVPVGRRPYTYSDATGLGVLTQTDPQGRWTFSNDSGSAGTSWDKISWNTEPEGNVPAGASITVEARASDSLVDLATSPYVPVVNNAAGLGLTGQHIEVNAVLRPDASSNTPILSDLSITSLASTDCDTNADGKIDRVDVGTISRNRNTPVPPGNPLWDLNGDNVINVVDGRLCALQCTNANCAP